MLEKLARKFFESSCSNIAGSASNEVRVETNTLRIRVGMQVMKACYVLLDLAAKTFQQLHLYLPVVHAQSGETVEINVNYRPIILRNIRGIIGLRFRVVGDYNFGFICGFERVPR
mmetsp:Transcript_6145/g.19755  ORF Transcript_6145/g.19755 Transcript_6145/m.19755 type:complete len:115 (-) Transcript_6145:155-499(-)